jgi:hypothetical protein
MVQHAFDGASSGNAVFQDYRYGRVVLAVPQPAACQQVIAEAHVCGFVVVVVVVVVVTVFLLRVN